MATAVKEVNLSNKRLQEILQVSKDYALTHGICIRSGVEKPESEKVVIAPYALFPSVIPGAILEQAKSSMEHFSQLMHRVAMNHEFMEQCLKTVIEVDPFMLSLWNIYCKVREKGVVQPLHLGLFRNDFMMNCLDETPPGQIVTADRLQLKHIEFNSIASSFGGLTQQIVDLHKLTLGMSGKDFKADQVPVNHPASGLASGMLKAWQLYGQPRAVIVFLVSSEERNVLDQRWLEFKIYESNPKVRVLRKTFQDIYRDGRLDEESRLFLDDDEVAVVYLRHGYTSENYTSQKDWDARLRLELSRAVKCPSVQHQLVGAKKIQQELARLGAVEKFISDPKIVADIRATFAGQYSLDMNEEGDATVKLALESPHKFVLKPQREGGGHNLYNNDITEFFKTHANSKERSAYILMERIFPWQQRNYLIKSGVPFALSDVVGELGIYGVFIGSEEGTVENYQCGHMMRTKIQGTDEGGVATGFAVLDTPFVL